MICENCGAEYDEHLLLCPYCGTENDRAAQLEHQKELHDLIHCAAGLALAASALLILFGIFLTPAVLRLMNTPEDIMELAVVYIRIYFLSMLPMVFYNIGSGILRAFGNSRSPMNYQLIGGIANVAGNAFFLCVLRMGVEGVALASLVSQLMAAVFTVGHLELPEQIIEESPALMAGMSLLHSMLMNIEESERWYQALEKGSRRVCGRLLACKIIYSFPRV